MFVVGKLKVESWEFKNYFAHFLLMLIGVHFLAAVAGFVVGACLFGFGQALKTSAPRETRIDAEGP